MSSTLRKFKFSTTEVLSRAKPKSTQRKDPASLGNDTASISVLSTHEGISEAVETGFKLYPAVWEGLLEAELTPCNCLSRPIKRLRPLQSIGPYADPSSPSCQVEGKAENEAFWEGHETTGKGIRHPGKIVRHSGRSM